MTFSCHCPGIVGRLSLKEEERIAAARKALDPESLLPLRRQRWAETK